VFGSGWGRSLDVLFLTILFVALSQGSVYALLPPIGRELGLSDGAIGSVVGASALVAFLSTSFLGQRIARAGARIALLAGVLGCALSLLMFAAVTGVAMHGYLSSQAFLAALIISRGLVFGLFFGVTIVGMFAYAAEITNGAKQRIQGVTAVQTANSVGQIAGPAIGGLLAASGFLVALVALPALSLSGFALAARALPESTPAAEARSISRQAVSARDPRVFRHLVALFIVQIPYAVMQMTTAFIVQDRFNLTAAQTARYSGAALSAFFVSAVFSQLFLVRRLGMALGPLLRLGCGIAGIALVGIVFAGSLLHFYALLGVLGLGMGIAQASATAAPSLAVAPSEVGSVSGLMGASVTLAFAVGHALGATLYSRSDALPYLLASLLLFALVLEPPSSTGEKE